MTKTKRNICIYSCPITTSRGTFSAGFSKKGLLFFCFPNDEKTVPEINTTLSAKQLTDLEKQKIRLTLWTEEYLKGNEKTPLPVQLDFSGFSGFRKDVTKQICAVLRGTTISYGELAKKTQNSSKYSRAAAGVCRTNPFPLLVPCHRIVASGGRPGGFAAGPEWKSFLLALEQE